MKRTFLLFFTLVVTMGVSEYEGLVEKMANFLEMTKDEARVCFSKTNITQEDLTKYDSHTVGDFQTDPENTAYKVGCLFACLGQKKEMMTGASINKDKIKDIMHSKPEEHRPAKPALFDQLVESCASQVETKTNECEVAITFTRCMNK